eukprot:15464001-Alexandrium_andersonii.AAC.1
MEALFASCSEEFQKLQSAQAQQAAVLENLQSEVRNILQKAQGLDSTIPQQFANINQRISALESRSPGAEPASAGVTPNSGGPQPATAGAWASGAGNGYSNNAGSWTQGWSSQDWDDWRRGSWRQSATAGAGASPDWRQSSSAQAPAPTTQTGA